MKGKVYKSCVRSAMIMEVKRGVYKKMAMLGLEESLDRMAKASSMQWYGHVLRREDNNVLLKALHFELLVAQEGDNQNKHGIKQVQKEMH